MPFDNVRFPTAIARGRTGGPERRTDVVLTASGREHRNSRWADSRHKYNVGYGVTSLADIEQVIAFFEERRGRLHAFRFKDHADFKSCAANATITASDQVIGTGNGLATTFQLLKTYGTGVRKYARDITAPVAGTVLVAINGMPTTNVSLDHTTGSVTFTTAPATGSSITAGFEFDVPVRFDTDELAINLSHFEAGEVPDIPLIEVRG
jgi:uncharacterized protein (TIGR02217 family)